MRARELKILIGAAGRQQKGEEERGIKAVSQSAHLEPAFLKATRAHIKKAAAQQTDNGQGRKPDTANYNFSSALHKEKENL